MKINYWLLALCVFLGSSIKNRLESQKVDTIEIRERSRIEKLKKINEAKIDTFLIKADSVTSKVKIIEAIPASLNETAKIQKGTNSIQTQTDRELDTLLLKSIEKKEQLEKSESLPVQKILIVSDQPTVSVPEHPVKKRKRFNLFRIFKK